jgi:hypothetical protein
MSFSVACFVKFHAKAQLIVDTLLDLGWCKEFVRLSYSKERLMETAKNLRRQPVKNDEESKTLTFVTEYLSTKHGINVDDVIRKAANEQRLKDEQETKDRADRALAHDMRIARAQRTAAFEEMDARASVGLSPVRYINPQDIF